MSGVKRRCYVRSQVDSYSGRTLLDDSMVFGEIINALRSLLKEILCL